MENLLRLNQDRWSILGIPVAAVVADPNRIAGATFSDEKFLAADSLENMPVAAFAEQAWAAVVDEVDPHIG